MRFFCLLVLLCSFSTQLTYLPVVGVRDAERLNILNHVYNPTSIAFLKKKGLKEGMTILDLGCGSGLMSCELARLVGAGGKVICLDISEEQLEIAKSVALQNGLTNLEFVKLDAYDLSQLQDKVDAIYCRFLLMHLKFPERIITNAYELLKKGGMLFIEEPTGLDAIKCYPMNSSFSEYLKLGEAQFRIYQTDAAIGCTLASELRKMNFHSVSSELFHPILHSSEERKLIRLSVEALTPSFVKSEIRTLEEMKATALGVKAIEEDPAYFVTYFQVAQVSGEK